MIARRLLFAASFGVLVCLGNAAYAQDEVQDGAPPNALEVRLLRPVSPNNVTVSEPVFMPAGQLMRVRVDVTNRSSRKRTLEYVFEWFDDQGMPAQTLAASQALFLDGRETRTLISVGQKTNAVNARLTISERDD